MKNEIKIKQGVKEKIINFCKEIIAVINNCGNDLLNENLKTITTIITQITNNNKK